MEDNLNPAEIAELEELRNLDTTLSQEEAVELDELRAIDNASKPSTTSSALRGAAQSVSFGFADEISGAVESTFTEKSYEQARDESRDAFNESKEENPAAFTSGEVAGAVLSTVASGGLGAGFRGAVALGTIAGVGLSEEDAIEGQISDAFLGGALGLAGQGIGSIVGKVATRAGRSIARFANTEADSIGLRALGVFTKAGRKKLSRKLDTKGLKPAQFLNVLENEVDEVGNPLIKLASSQEELLQDMIARKGQLGGEMGAILKQVDIESGAVEKGFGSINPKDLANHLETELLDPLRASVSAIPEEQALMRQLEKRVAMLQESKSTWNMTDLNAWKSKVAQSAGFLKRQNTDLQLHSQLQKVVSKTNDFIHEKVESISGSPETLAKFKNIKQRWAVLNDAEEFVEDSVQANAEGALGSIRKALGMAAFSGGATITGGLIGGVPGAALGMAMTVAAKSPKVNQSIARSLRKVGTSLSQNPANGEYIEILMKSATRGSDAFKAAIEMVEMKVDGKITSPEEAAEHTQNVRNSNVPARAKLQLMQQIQSGMVPRMDQVEVPEPVFKQFVPRERDESGMKK